MKKFLIILMLVCFTTTGCTGSFNLTKKVYNLHRSQTDKWQDEFVFLVVALLPIYSLSTLADAIVFNSIEFWTGENPVVLKEDPTIKHAQTKGEATLSYNPKSDQLTIASGHSPKLILEKSDDMILAKNEQGQVLFSSVKDDKGQVVVYDKNLDVVKTYSAKDVDSIKEKSSK